MNTPFLTTRIVLIITFFFTQQMCSMELAFYYGKRLLSKCFYREPVQNKQFDRFSELPKETQLLIFKYSDNKTNFQKTNTYWYQTGSIQSPQFINEFDGIGNQRMCRIFLNAVYTKNYNGVENILKHYYAQRPDRGYCYFVDTDRKGKDIVLDSYDIAGIGTEMLKLLRKYKIEEAKRSASPSPLVMACLSGSSDRIECFIKDSKCNIKRALNIVISCDYEKCMQQLLNNVNKSDAFEELFLRDEDRVLWKHQFLINVCIYKSYKVLKIVLNSNFYNKNEIVDDKTLLDEVLAMAEKDCTFNPVVEILKKYGAQTAEQLEKNDEDEEDMLGPIRLPF